MNRFKNYLVTSLIACGISIFATAQVTFTKMPKDRQFFPRNITTGRAPVVISGTVNNAGVDYASVRVKAYRSNVLVATKEQNLVYNNGKANFLFSDFIKAELANYKVEVYGVNQSQEVLLSSASNLVAGDAYLIQGQSNAEASSYRGSTESLRNNYIRSYGTGNENGTTDKWYIGTGDGDRKDGGHAGQWGLRLAKYITDTYQIPVCIINGAHGGMAISFFARNDGRPLDQNTNYGRTLKRVKDAGLTNFIRGVFWYQGETDVLLQTDTGVHNNAFRDLYNDWNRDMPGIEAFYIFQIRKGCGNNNERSGKIMECHRQLAEELAKTNIMASNGASHFVDGCHFPYTNGYEFHANNIFRLIQRDMYGVTGALNIEPPQVVSARLVNAQQIELTLKNTTDTYLWETGSERDFDINGTNVSVVSGSVNGNKVTLNLSGNATGAYSIDYFGHEGAKTPFIKNLNGIGMVSFWEYPLQQAIYKPASMTVAPGSVIE